MTLTAPESTPGALRGPRGQIVALGLAALATAPGVVARLAGIDLGAVGARRWSSASPSSGRRS